MQSAYCGKDKYESRRNYPYLPAGNRISEPSYKAYEAELSNTQDSGNEYRGMLLEKRLGGGISGT